MEFKNPVVTVDVIVEYQDGIVFIQRGRDPFREFWALPGGHLEYGKEEPEEAALRELFEETGLEGRREDLKLLNVYGKPDRDPRGHYLTVVYCLENVTGQLREGDDAKAVKIFKSPKKDDLLMSLVCRGDYYAADARYAKATNQLDADYFRSFLFAFDHNRIMEDYFQRRASLYSSSLLTKL